MLLAETNNLHAIIQTVFDKNGNVSPTIARQFLAAASSDFVFIDWELENRGLSALSLGMKVSLYESLAKEQNEDNFRHFSSLNAALGLSEDFYKRQAQTVETFFADPEKIESFWKQAGNSQTFARIFRQITSKECRLNETHKKRFVEFVATTYAKHCKIPVLYVDFYEADPLQYGYAHNDTLSINTRSHFSLAPFRLLLDIIHEVDHFKQAYLALDYERGKIAPSDPHYLAARIFMVNFQNYMGSQAPCEGYWNQPIEVSARYSSEKAMEIATRSFGLPQPNDSSDYNCG